MEDVKEFSDNAGTEIGCGCYGCNQGFHYRKLKFIGRHG
jgi:hypothetical protein